MDRQKFLAELRRELYFLPADELEDAINYYDEYISESEDEETALWELGSPKRVAEDFKKEYYDKNSENSSLPAKRTFSDKSDAQTKRPVWLYVLLIVIAIGFGLPVLKLLGGFIFSATSILVLIIIVLVLITALRNKSRSYEQNASYVQTCSDIAGLDINLGAGMFVIEQGDGFSIRGGRLQSNIAGGVWHISGSSVDSGHIHPSDEMITTITIPNCFTAETAKIRLGAGNLLIKGLSAYTMKLEVSVGNMEGEGLYSKNLNIKCGVGRMKADASMHGDVNISCGMGDTSVRFTNRAEEFNCITSVGLGKAVVNGQEIRGRSVNNNGAPHNMNIKCGMGNVRVDFSGVI